MISLMKIATPSGASAIDGVLAERGVFREQAFTNQGLSRFLYLSRRLVELMGGILALESGPGKGGAFTVTLAALAVPSLV